MVLVVRGDGVCVSEWRCVSGEEMLVSVRVCEWFGLWEYHNLSIRYDCSSEWEGGGGRATLLLST